MEEAVVAAVVEVVDLVVEYEVVLEMVGRGLVVEMVEVLVEEERVGLMWRWWLEQRWRMKCFVVG